MGLKAWTIGVGKKLAARKTAFQGRCMTFLAAPYTGGVMTLCIIAAGALASFYAEAIKQSMTWPLSWENFPGNVVAFWILSALSGILFSGAQWAQARRAKEVSDSVTHAIRRLSTLPAESFLPAYQAAFKQAGLNAILALQEISDPEAKIAVVDLAIRNVLESIVQTARSFDGARDETQYSASLMLFRQRFADLATKEPVLQFDGYDERQLAGYLELMPELSTNKERAFVSLVLPVHRETKKIVDHEGKERFRVLPGAPWAYTYRAAAWFESVDIFVDSLINTTSLDHYSVLKVREYFEEGPARDVKSFASIPILQPSFEMEQGSEVLGVLNLHSSEEGLLSDNGKTLYAPLLAPFNLLLSVLLVERSGCVPVAQSVADRGFSVTVLHKSAE